MIASFGRGLSAFAISTGFPLWIVFALPAEALEMPDLVVDSISAHPEVKEKIHAYRRIVNDQVIAESGWRPSVDLSASTGFYDTESPTTGNQSVDYDSSTIELSLTQNLFSGYDTTYQVEQTKARATAALYEIYDTADNLALRAIQAYLDVLKQRRLYRLAVENVEAHEEILAQIRDRNLSGVGRRSQLQQTEGRVARAHASLVAQLNNLEDAATLLHQILGRYIDPDALLEPDIPALPPDDLDLLIDRALEFHPAMRVAESNIQAAQADHKRSLKSRYPNVDLRLATEYGNDINGLSGDTEETSIVLNLTYNFYNGGRTDAESEQKINAVYEQKEFAARVRRQIINTLRLAWIADKSLARQLEFLNTHIIKAGQTVESYKEEFFIGQRDLIDLLDAENELNSAKNQHTEAKYDGLSARFRVYEGIGYLLQTTNVEFEVSEDSLKVARLQSDATDKLPIPKDEDLDKEIDPMDHCDNSLIDSPVDPFGCFRPEVTRVEPDLPKPNAVPVLVDDFFEIETNSVLVITQAELLANDSDADSDPLEIVDISQPDIGRLAFNQNSNLIYRSTEGFIGVDTFKYTATDNRGGSASATATVNIQVIQPDDIDLSKVQLVNFVYDEAKLTEISKSRVEAIIGRIKQSENISIEVNTYTDNIGSDGYNLRLSKRRAEALRDLLISNGIDAADIKAVGRGENNPIADNSTRSGQAINRRGEFIFKAKIPNE